MKFEGNADGQQLNRTRQLLVHGDVNLLDNMSTPQTPQEH
jgi:hypothetical protein